MTQEEIARYLGGARESVADAEVLSAEEGLVSLSRGGVTVLNRKGPGGAALSERTSSPASPGSRPWAAPATVLATLPSLKTIKVGMLITRKAFASSGWASMSTFGDFDVLVFGGDPEITNGDTIRQGPHQLAQKSTSTGLSLFRNSRWKFSMVKFTTDIVYRAPLLFVAQTYSAGRPLP